MSCFQVLEDRQRTVSDLNDLFFSRGARIKDRKDALAARISENSDLEGLCSGILLKLGTASKKLMGSLELASLELQVELLEQLTLVPELGSLAQSVAELTVVNHQTPLQLIRIVKDRFPEIAEKLRCLEILTYQDGIWKCCSKCKTLFQGEFHCVDS